MTPLLFYSLQLQAKKKYHMRFQVLMATSIKIVAFWDVVLCSLMEVDWHFRGAHCLHHQGNMKAVHTYETLVYFHETTRCYILENYNLQIIPCNTRENNVTTLSTSWMVTILPVTHILNKNSFIKKCNHYSNSPAEWLKYCSVQKYQGNILYYYNYQIFTIITKHSLSLLYTRLTTLFVNSHLLLTKTSVQLLPLL
jgi:hypothetical protein